MLRYIGLLISSAWRALTGRYGWMLILFVLWLYRVDFVVADEGGLAKALQVVTIFGMLGLTLMYRPRVIGQAFGRSNASVKLFLWLYVLGVVSTLWAYWPTFAFFLSFQNIVLVLVLLWMFSLARTFEQMERLFLLSAVLIALFEVTVVRIRGGGFFIHQLTGSSTAAVLISYCVGELLAGRQRKNKRRRWLLKQTLMMALLILVTSTSSGANASAVCGVAVALFFSGNIVYAFPLMLIGGVLFFNQDKIDDLLLLIMPGKTKETLESGNGRETIWNGIFAVTAQRMWHGWGFACGERAASLYLRWTLSDAHNNYIGMYGGLGLTGVFLLLVQQLAALWAAFVRRMKTGYLGLFSALCCVTINGYSYGYLSGKACSITVIYVSLLVLTLYYRKLERVRYDESAE